MEQIEQASQILDHVIPYLFSLEKNQNPSVRIKKPFNDQKEIKIMLDPGKEQIILARVPDFTNPTGGIGSVQFIG